MDEKTKVLVERLINAATMHRKHPCEVYDMVALANEAAAAIRAQAEEIERLKNENLRWQESRDIFVAKAEAAEARLAALTTAEGCDVEGALDAYMDAPNKGLPYDFLVQQRMSAALAAGCAPLRAKLALYETALRKIACWHVVAPEVNYPHYASMAVVTAREVVSQKEPANGNP